MRRRVNSNYFSGFLFTYFFYKNPHNSKKSGESPVTFSEPKLNEYYLGAIDHDRTQFEIPVVAMITENTLEKINKIKKSSISEPSSTDSIQI